MMTISVMFVEMHVSVGTNWQVKSHEMNHVFYNAADRFPLFLQKLILRHSS